MKSAHLIPFVPIHSDQKILFLQMICRTVMCHSTRELSNGICTIYDGDRDAYGGLVLKLTSGELDTVCVDELSGTDIQDNIVALLADQIPGFEKANISIKMVYQDNKGTGFNNIFIIIHIDQCPWTFAYLDMEPILNVHNKSFSVTLSPNNMGMNALVELSGPIVEQ